MNMKTVHTFKISDVVFIMLIHVKCQQFSAFQHYEHDKFCAQLS